MLIQRFKRGLINAGGSVSKTIFGALDENDAVNFNLAIEKLKASDSHLLNLVKQQTSVLKNTFDTSKNNSKQHNIPNFREN